MLLDIDPNINVIAVSKQRTPAEILPLLQSGHRLFGENRVSEAFEKWPSLRESFPGVELHMIGALQTNKVAQAVEVFDVIQTLDREALADTLAAEMARQNKSLSCFIQVNTGEEPQKAGCRPQALETLYRYATEQAGLNVIGLMCLPPIDEVCALHFGLLRQLAGNLGLKNLSMGMSADYKTALRYGATHVRLGTALFGPRDLSPYKA